MAKRRLETLLEKHASQVQVIGTASDGEEGLRLINKKKPDVIFLDIQMPVMNGFEMLTHLENQPKIIFTTAYDEYALQSFEANSIDYLLKPIKAERLEKAIAKLMQLVPKQNTQSFNLDQLKNLMMQLNQKTAANVLRVTFGDRIVIVKLDCVQYLQAEDKLTKVVDETDKTYFINPSLKQLESKLPPSFVQVSRSFIINENYVKELRKGFNRKLVFEMNNGEKITVGSTYALKLKERWSF